MLVLSDEFEEGERERERGRERGIERGWVEEERLPISHAYILTCGCHSDGLLLENIYYNELLPKSDIVIIISLVRRHHQLDGETCKCLIYSG